MRKPVYIPIETLYNNTYECNLNIRQGDTLDVTFKVFEKSVLKDLTGQTVTIVLKKSNNTIVEKVVTSFPAIGTLKVTFDELATNVKGLVRGIIEISDSNGQSTTNMFTYTVRESFVSDIIDLSTNDIITLSQLQQIIKHAEEIIDRYQSAIDSVAGTGEQIAQLEAVKMFIENTLEQLIGENAKALINVQDLNDGNNAATSNIADLRTENSRAELLIQQLRDLNNQADTLIQTLTDKNLEAANNIQEITDKLVEMHAIEANIIRENEAALQNIANLQNENALSQQNLAALQSENATAVENQHLLDEKILDAEEHLNNLDALNNDAKNTHTLLDDLNNDSKLTHTNLDALNNDAKNTKAELDDANKLAEKHIDTIKNLDPTNVVSDVGELKAEVHKARGTFADLDARIAEAEGSGGFFMNDTLPDISNRKSGILYMQIL